MWEDSLQEEFLDSSTQMLNSKNKVDFPQLLRVFYNLGIFIRAIFIQSSFQQMRLLFSIALLFLFCNLGAQNVSDKGKVSTTYERMSETVTVSKLQGKWQNVDSPQHQIEFRMVNGVFSLGAAYQFISKGKGLVCAVGVLMRWPPAYCYVISVQDGKLELEFSGVANANPKVYIYRKVE